MTLAKPALFFDTARDSVLGPTLEQGEVDGCNALLAVMDGAPLAWTAYALATAYHETAGKLHPIREYGSTNYFDRRYGPPPVGQKPALARSLGNTQPGDGSRYCGRGFVQLTGRRNYDLWSGVLGVDLVGNPDKALEPAIAARIMREGMTRGAFTGKGFADYLPSHGPAETADFRRAGDHQWQRSCGSYRDRGDELPVCASIGRVGVTNEPQRAVLRWALAAVAFTSAALIGYTAWLIWLLGVADWCGRAVGASIHADARPEYAVGGCFSLLNKQVSSLSIMGFIALGTLALCLAVLVVIVLAGGKLSLKASKDGVDVDVGKEPGDAAQFVASKAQDAADTVADKAASGT